MIARFTFCLMSSAALAAPATAQPAAPTTTAQPAAPAASAPTTANRNHAPTEGAEIIVTAQRRARVDLLSAVTVVSGEALVQQMRPSIGETLARQPGVSSTSFGPAASRPVLRGLGGDRIRILTDGIGSFDASTVSADHAVAINPLTAERIEILRGPAALLFGSSAVGGVVNVIDTRIPRRIPEEAIHAEGLALYGTAAKERDIRGKVDLPLGGNFVAHVDGSYAKTGDLRTGGFILSRRLREQAAMSADPEIAALARLRSKLPNSALRTWDVAGGLAYLTERATIGGSATHYESLYGIPIRYSLEPGVEADRVRLNVRQDRYDARAEYGFDSGPISRVLLRGGYANYRHDEIGPDGAIGTSFFNKGGEGRLELVQRRQGVWSGSVGAQYFSRNFRAQGDEKFVPPTLNKQAGLFALQNFDLDPVLVEGGVRVERTRVDAREDAVLGTDAARRQYTTVSASLGAGYRLSERARVGINLNRAVRAPNAEELFAQGPHAGTQAFEIGNRNLRTERSTGGELFFRSSNAAYNLEVTGFYNRFSNFIYEFATGDVENSLPVYITRQGKATQAGFEAQGRLRLAQLGSGAIWGDALADYTRVRIKNFGPAPLIPPLRVLGGLSYESPKLDGGFEVERAMRQNANAPGETQTPGFTMVNASLSYRPQGKDGPLTFSLAANNLFDVEARRHSSLLKEFAPLAGRDVRFSIAVRY